MLSSPLLLMASLALPLTALSVFLTRHNAEEERKKAEGEQSSDVFLKRYGVGKTDETGSRATSTTSASQTQMQHQSPRDRCDILLLGSGWISNFAVPVVASKGLSISATTREVKDGDSFERIPFIFDDDHDLDEQVGRLPIARTVVIVFPIRGEGRVKRLYESYTRIKASAQWIQLGSTGIWGSKQPGQSPWIDRFTAPDSSNPRYQAEEELLKLSSDSSPTAILNLAGLYGQQRKPSNFLIRVQESLEQKGSVHFVHGVDVARAIILMHEKFTPGQRWILTDGRVHDWWNIALDKGEPNTMARIKVQALTKLLAIKALPRPICDVVPGDATQRSTKLIRALDSSHFWQHFDDAPYSGGLS
ncbi:hypothetical protein E3P99_03153 [Wallemia hederae]|uniref:NAD-dependent epimerase/dehydratase domain-containing protein n=1 Tax=Wallemia hederae TaxID=1540922 RepID=A0A4T0FL51_9BASI|nr:hypothetical protein E3P99_03153 [Wallemia hederae]